MSVFRMTLAGIAALFGVGIFAGYSLGYRLNTTQSLPPGVYRFVEAPPEAILRGDTVIACPENTELQKEARERGYLPLGLGCPNRFTPLLKKAMALPGDVIAVTEYEIVINGVPVQNSSRLSVDSQGRVMPDMPKSETVPEGRVWLLSDYAKRSWDSRYFGSVPLKTIKGFAVPVWTLSSY